MNKQPDTDATGQHKHKGMEDFGSFFHGSSDSSAFLKVQLYAYKQPKPLIARLNRSYRSIFILSFSFKFRAYSSEFLGFIL